jgi:hypothetical protein
MKFSEVIAALEDGKKVRRENTNVYLVMAEMPGLKRQLIEVWTDGAWTHTSIEFGGDTAAEGWSIVP